MEDYSPTIEDNITKSIDLIKYSDTRNSQISSLVKQQHQQLQEKHAQSHHNVRPKIDITTCPVTLEINDMTGQDEFIVVYEGIMKQTQGFVVVYSISDEQSLRDAEDALKAIIKYKEQEKDNALLVEQFTENYFNLGYHIPCVLLGNKRDLGLLEPNNNNSERRVTWEQGKALANKYGIMHFAECSAKLDDVKIHAAFGELAMMICKQKMIKEYVEKNLASSGNSKNNKSCSVM